MTPPRTLQGQLSRTDKCNLTTREEKNKIRSKTSSQFLHKAPTGPQKTLDIFQKYLNKKMSRNPQERSGDLTNFAKSPRCWNTNLVKRKKPPMVGITTVIDTEGYTWEEKPRHEPTPSRADLASARQNMQTVRETR